MSWITEINELFHNILIYWDALYFLAHIGHPYYGKRGRGAAHLHLNKHSQKHNSK